MLNIFRKIINAVLLNSPYYFEDGSQISHLAQFDILRYRTAGANPKILDIGLEYNRDTRLMRVESSRSWKWRVANVPLNQNSEGGVELTVQEKADVIHKVREFIEKHPKKYTRFESNA
jgi:hypothetical protein